MDWCSLVKKYSPDPLPKISNLTLKIKTDYLLNRVSSYDVTKAFTDSLDKRIEQQPQNSIRQRFVANKNTPRLRWISWNLRTTGGADQDLILDF